MASSRRRTSLFSTSTPSPTPPTTMPPPPNKPLFERFNTHDSHSVELPLFGSTWRLAQAPNTNHLGTTVWDASIILAKWMEKNARKGSELSRPKLAGKKVLELGAGMGLGGLAAAALGAEVELTDVAEVLPLLKQNAESLMGKASLATSDAPWVAGVGSVSVRELDWDKRSSWFLGEEEGGEGGGGSGKKGAAATATVSNESPSPSPSSSVAASPSSPRPSPPHYDFILAADCVYKEDILPTLRDVILALSTRRTVVVVANELRSHSVAAAFEQTFAPHFSMKRVPRAKMDAEYSVDAISIVIMKRKHAPGGGAKAGEGEATTAAEGGGGGEEVAAALAAGLTLKEE